MFVCKGRTPWLNLSKHTSQGRNKNGEVVGPAGGETGEPRCLAEVYDLLPTQQNNPRSCKAKRKLSHKSVNSLSESFKQAS